jgi:hypothetical protein
MAQERTYTYRDCVLDPQEVQFYRSERGVIALRLGVEEYQDLNIRRAFPLEYEDHFIGIFLADGTELGLLENIDDLEEASRQVLLEELDKIYFRPRILQIHDLDEEHGVLRGHIETTSGSRYLEIRNYRRNVRLLANHRALVVDADGNCYQIDDWRQLPRMTREILGL